MADGHGSLLVHAAYPIVPTLAQRDNMRLRIAARSLVQHDGNL
jgi:hypothetical protein